MIDSFISSKSRIKMMRLFLLNPRKEFYLREIAKDTRSNTNSVRLELKELEKVGFLFSVKKGRQKYFSVNKDFFIFEELKSIFLKEFGVLISLKETVLDVDGISFAFVYGSVAEGKERSDSDIDLMIIGKPDLDELNLKIKKMEEKFKREINYIVFSIKEFNEKKNRKTHFISNILKSKKIMIKGSENEL